ncbi:MAG TPA: NADPH:quinone reductase [Alphaproteobacteria bacterium]|jgi:NADPH2:quinone reductase|nr:NADPH:quinone reductase [Alphaproteobacteria bacterium]
MRAGWYERPGPAHDVIVVGEMPTPEPGPGEVRVRLRASGISPSDYKRRANAKGAMEFPRIIPHSDGAGLVDAVGEGVRGYARGDRVWTMDAQFKRPYGTAAEYIVLPAEKIAPLPDAASFEAGACLGIPAMTAYRAVYLDGPVSGQTVLVSGGAGRVAHCAIQFAKIGGARVLATASTPEKAAIARAAGAEDVIDRSGDVAARILDLTGGVGVDRVVEVEFGGNLETNQRILKDGGAIASYASSQVPQPRLTVTPRRASNMTIHFVYCYTMPADAKHSAAREINRMLAQHGFVPRIARTFALDALADAHAYSESSSGDGQVVVTID